MYCFCCAGNKNTSWHTLYVFFYFTPSSFIYIWMRSFLFIIVQRSPCTFFACCGLVVLACQTFDLHCDPFTLTMHLGNPRPTRRSDCRSLATILQCRNKDSPLAVKISRSTGRKTTQTLVRRTLGDAGFASCTCRWIRIVGRLGIDELRAATVWAVALEIRNDRVM